MKIAFNPSTVAALTTPPNNKDITFDLRGRNIFARGVKFYGTDTNTWRDIKINNVSIGSHTLDLRNGSNITLSNTNGVVAINSTWRPVVDNLTSDSTTSSLSANQGRVLAGLINGKSDSDHNHDGRYVRKSGDTMSGVLTIDTTNFGALTIKRNDDVNGASIQFRGKSNIYGYIGFNAANRNKQLLRWNGASSQVYTILDTSSTYISGGKGVINGTTITQVDNADKLDGYHANTSQSPFGRVPTIGGDGVMEIGKYIDFHYDNEGKYDYSTRLQATGNHQNTLLLPSGTGTLALTSQIPNKNSWNYDDRYLKLTGGAMVGTINRRSGGSTISGRDHAIIRQTHAPGGSSWNPIACVDTETGTWTLGHLSSGSSNTDFSFCFSTNADYNAGNNAGNYVTLRNRVGTIALTSEIPSKGSWNYDDRYYTKAESNAKYITDITTSVNKLTFTKNGSSIARTITVNNVQSLGKRSPLTERNAISGIYTYGTYSATDNLAPTNYFETLGFGEGVAGTIEIGGSWISRGKLYWRALRDCCEDWFSWKTILDSSNYSSILDSRYYTESEVNSLLSKKLDRVNLSVGTWNPRGYSLAADYHYNGGNLSISENGSKMYVSIDGQFYQNEGQYRVLDTSDIGSIRGGLTLYQHLSATDANWYPLVWGGGDHKNTNNSTGSLYKSYDKLSWQTSSQTLYATKLKTTNLDTQTAFFHPGNDSTLKIYSGKTQDAVSDGHIGLQTSINNTDGQTHGYPTQYGSRCVLALQPRGGSVYIGNMPNGGNGRKLNVNGDIGLFNTGSIRDLSIGGGIYWNPYVESATDGSDAASITLVKSGVAGGTTLVLSQMNDANDTIQFKTSTAAKLYHNSYPILTTQNTYVNNHKGYIYGTEITQVNNSDTVDGWHKDNIQWTGYITSGNTLASYWFKMYDITVTGYQYNDITITFLVSEGFSSNFSIFHLKIRQNGTNNSGNYNLGVTLKELVGNLRDKVVVYYNNSTGNVQLWGNPNGQYNTMNYTILKKTTRTATDSSSLGILTAQSFSSVQTPPSTGYTKVTMARVGYVSYSDSTGSVHWNNVTNKPSTFNPAAHTHSWASITGKIVAGNEFNIVNAGFKESMWFNYLPINDRSKTATISGYHFGNGAKGHASIVASGFIKSGGNASQLLRADGGVAAFNWSGQAGQPTWLWGGNSQHSYYVYNPSNFKVASATKLQTARKIWGQSFDGTTDIDNTLRIRKTTGNYCEGIRIQTGDGNWATIILGATADSGTNTNAWSIHRKSDNNFAISRNSADGTNGLVMTSTGMGLGTTTPTQRLEVVGNIKATGQIIRGGSSQAWVNGRNGALLRETSVSGYHALWSLKTTNGSWDFGEYTAGSGWNNVPVLSYVTDSNYNTGNNTTTYQIRFPLDSGTVALTKNIPSSLPANGGNADTVDGYHATDGRTFNGNINWSSNWNDTWSDGTNKHPWYGFDHRYPNTGAYSTTLSDYFGMTIKTANTLRLDCKDLLINGTNISNLNVASATNAYHLRINSANSWSTWYWAGQGGQPSWLWGSNDGTNMYVWNPSNFKVAYATSAGNADTVDGKHASDFAPASHTHGYYAVNENYGGFKKAGRLPTSGFYQSYESESGGNAPWSSQMHLINCQHSNTSNNYALQIAASFYDNNTFKIRVTNNNVNNAWQNIIHSGNIGSQSVAYASKAGSVAWSNVTGKPTIPNPTDYYWANIKVSASSNTQTTPSVNTIYANNWFRSQGASGWYSESYGGGIHMSDTTWIRTYGDKPFYCNKQIYSSDSIRMGDIYLQNKNEINNGANGDLYLNYRNTGDIILCNGGGKVGIGKSDPLYKLDVAGNGRFQDFVYCNAVYSNTLNHTSPTGHLIIGNKTKEISIRSSYLPDVPAVYLYQKFSTNVYYTANKGFGIRPYYLSSMDYRPIETISGNMYSVVTVGDSVQAISCIIADKADIMPQIRGTLIRFLPGDDGQIVLLKDLNNYGGINGYFYVQPKGCNIIGANNFNIHIADGNISDACDDGKSRFFIYAKTHKVWIEFYCG